VVRDVTSFGVDVPAGLGSVAGSIRDDSAPILAALALLAAAAAAASGTGLVLAWSRQQETAE
jgi:Zn-dependent protease with chaperone function